MGVRTILPLSVSPSNQIATDVLGMLAKRGIGEKQRSDVIWRLILLALRTDELLGDLAAAADGNPDARFVVESLDARGLTGIDRADEVWAMLAAYLRGEAAQQMNNTASTVDLTDVLDALDGW